jgi:carbonic anhydrase/acetyltransferase-like protein (isoleucine patch superfamily)
MSSLIPFHGKAPIVDPAAFVAPGARLIGDIEIGPEASIWYNTVLRGDVNRIRIGARTNIQDGSVLHVDSPRPGHEAGHPTLIGDEVLIGHLAMVHGCVLHDRAFVGLGAIVMDGCEIESDAMLAAGALLTRGRSSPPASSGPGVRPNMSATWARRTSPACAPASPIMSRWQSSTPRRCAQSAPDPPQPGLLRGDDAVRLRDRGVERGLIGGAGRLAGAGQHELVQLGGGVGGAAARHFGAG